MHLAAGRLRPVYVLPDAVIGMRGHTLVEVPRRERRDDADNLLETEPQGRAAGERRNGGADLARRDHGLDDRQLTVRRPFLHKTTLTYLVNFGKLVNEGGTAAVDTLERTPSGVCPLFRAPDTVPAGTKVSIPFLSGRERSQSPESGEQDRQEPVSIPFLSGRERSRRRW